MGFQRRPLPFGQARQVNSRFAGRSAGAAEILPGRVAGGLADPRRRGDDETCPCGSAPLPPMPPRPAFFSSLRLPLSALGIGCRPLFQYLTGYRYVLVSLKMSSQFFLIIAYLKVHSRSNTSNKLGLLWTWFFHL